MLENHEYIFLTYGHSSTCLHCFYFSRQRYSIFDSIMKFCGNKNQFSLHLDEWIRIRIRQNDADSAEYGSTPLPISNSLSDLSEIKYSRNYRTFDYWTKKNDQEIASLYKPVYSSLKFQNKCTNIHIVGEVLSFFSSRRNWDSPNSSPAGEYAPPPLWYRGTLAGERGGGESQFRYKYIYVLCANN